MVARNIKDFPAVFSVGPAMDFDYVQAFFLEYRNTALCGTVFRLHIETSTVKQMVHKILMCLGAFSPYFLGSALKMGFAAIYATVGCSTKWVLWQVTDRGVTTSAWYFARL